MNKWKFYTSKELKPEGWLKRQLEIQAEGAKRMNAKDFLRGNQI